MGKNIAFFRRCQVFCLIMIKISLAVFSVTTQ